jgi:ADP-ribose pyrophosphatase YjhB (NUDIX family)
VTEAGPHNPTRAAVAAGALFTDANGRIMLVHPTYKDYWDIPGGYVEPGETPYQACVREVAEELGIWPKIGALLAVDWAPGLGDGDKILFIFDGGQLTDANHAAIQLQREELSEYAYLGLDAVADRTIPRLHRRLIQAHQSRLAGGPIYLEHGQPVPVSHS